MKSPVLRFFSLSDTENVKAAINGILTNLFGITLANLPHGCLSLENAPEPGETQRGFLLGLGDIKVDEKNAKRKVKITELVKAMIEASVKNGIFIRFRLFDGDERIDDKLLARVREHVIQAFISGYDVGNGQKVCIPLVFSPYPGESRFPNELSVALSASAQTNNNVFEKLFSAKNDLEAQLEKVHREIGDLCNGLHSRLVNLEDGSAVAGAASSSESTAASSVDVRHDVIQGILELIDRSIKNLSSLLDTCRHKQAELDGLAISGSSCKTFDKFGAQVTAVNNDLVRNIKDFLQRFLATLNFSALINDEQYCATCALLDNLCVLRTQLGRILLPDVLSLGDLKNLEAQIQAAEKIAIDYLQSKIIDPAVSRFFADPNKLKLVTIAKNQHGVGDIFVFNSVILNGVTDLNEFLSGHFSGAKLQTELRKFGIEISTEEAASVKGGKAWESIQDPGLKLLLEGMSPKRRNSSYPATMVLIGQLNEAISRAKAHRSNADNWAEVTRILWQLGVEDEQQRQLEGGKFELLYNIVAGGYALERLPAAGRGDVFAGDESARLPDDLKGILREWDAVDTQLDEMRKKLRYNWLLQKRLGIGARGIQIIHKNHGAQITAWRTSNMGNANILLVYDDANKLVVYGRGGDGLFSMREVASDSPLHGLFVEHLSPLREGNLDELLQPEQSAQKTEIIKAVFDHLENNSGDINLYISLFAIGVEKTREKYQAVSRGWLMALEESKEKLTQLQDYVRSENFRAILAKDQEGLERELKDVLQAPSFAAVNDLQLWARHVKKFYFVLDSRQKALSSRGIATEGIDKMLPKLIAQLKGIFSEFISSLERQCDAIRELADPKKRLEQIAILSEQWQCIRRNMLEGSQGLRDVLLEEEGTIEGIIGTAQKEGRIVTDSREQIALYRDYLLHLSRSFDLSIAPPHMAASLCTFFGRIFVDIELDEHNPQLFCIKLADRMKQYIPAFSKVVEFSIFAKSSMQERVAVLRYWLKVAEFCEKRNASVHEAVCMGCSASVYLLVGTTCQLDREVVHLREVNEYRVKVKLGGLLNNIGVPTLTYLKGYIELAHEKGQDVNGVLYRYLKDRIAEEKHQLSASTVELSKEFHKWLNEFMPFAFCLNTNQRLYKEHTQYFDALAKSLEPGKVEVGQLPMFGKIMYELEEEKTLSTGVVVQDLTEAGVVGQGQAEIVARTLKERAYNLRIESRILRILLSELQHKSLVSVGTLACISELNAAVKALQDFYANPRATQAAGAASDHAETRSARTASDQSGTSALLTSRDDDIESRLLQRLTNALADLGMMFPHEADDISLQNLSRELSSSAQLGNYVSALSKARALDCNWETAGELYQALQNVQTLEDAAIPEKKQRVQKAFESLKQEFKTHRIPVAPDDLVSLLKHEHAMNDSMVVCTGREAAFFDEEISSLSGLRAKLVEKQSAESGSCMTNPAATGSEEVSSPRASVRINFNIGSFGSSGSSPESMASNPLFTALRRGDGDIEVRRPLLNDGDERNGGVSSPSASSSAPAGAASVAAMTTVSADRPSSPPRTEAKQSRAIKGALFVIDEWLFELQHRKELDELMHNLEKDLKKEADLLSFDEERVTTVAAPVREESAAAVSVAAATAGEAPGSPKGKEPIRPRSDDDSDSLSTDTEEEAEKAEKKSPQSWGGMILTKAQRIRVLQARVRELKNQARYVLSIESFVFLNAKLRPFEELLAGYCDSLSYVQDEVYARFPEIAQEVFSLAQHCKNDSRLIPVIRDITNILQRIFDKRRQLEIETQMVDKLCGLELVEEREVRSLGELRQDVISHTEDVKKLFDKQNELQEREQVFSDTIRHDIQQILSELQALHLLINEQELKQGIFAHLYDELDICKNKNKEVSKALSNKLSVENRRLVDKIQSLSAVQEALAAVPQLIEKRNIWDEARTLWTRVYNGDASVAGFVEKYRADFVGSFEGVFGKDPSQHEVLCFIADSDCLVNLLFDGIVNNQFKRLQLTLVSDYHSAKKQKIERALPVIADDKPEDLSADSVTVEIVHEGNVLQVSCRELFIRSLTLFAKIKGDDFIAHNPERLPVEVVVNYNQYCDSLSAFVVMQVLSSGRPPMLQIKQWLRMAKALRMQRDYLGFTSIVGAFQRAQVSAIVSAKILDSSAEFNLAEKQELYTELLHFALIQKKDFLHLQENAVVLSLVPYTSFLRLGGEGANAGEVLRRTEEKCKGDIDRVSGLAEKKLADLLLDAQVDQRSVDLITNFSAQNLSIALEVSGGVVDNLPLNICKIESSILRSLLLDRKVPDITIEELERINCVLQNAAEMKSGELAKQLDRSGWSIDAEIAGNIKQEALRRRVKDPLLREILGGFPNICRIRNVILRRFFLSNKDCDLTDGEKTSVGGLFANELDAGRIKTVIRDVLHKEVDDDFVRQIIAEEQKLRAQGRKFAGLASGREYDKREVQLQAKYLGIRTFAVIDRLNKAAERRDIDGVVEILGCDLDIGEDIIAQYRSNVCVDVDRVLRSAAEAVDRCLMRRGDLIGKINQTVKTLLDEQYVGAAAEAEFIKVGNDIIQLEKVLQQLEKELAELEKFEKSAQSDRSDVLRMKMLEISGMKGDIRFAIDGLREFLQSLRCNSVLRQKVPSFVRLGYHYNLAEIVRNNYDGKVAKASAVEFTSRAFNSTEKFSRQHELEFPEMYRELARQGLVDRLRISSPEYMQYLTLSMYLFAHCSLCTPAGRLRLGIQNVLEVMPGWLQSLGPSVIGDLTESYCLMILYTPTWLRISSDMVRLDLFPTLLNLILKKDIPRLRGTVSPDGQSIAGLMRGIFGYIDQGRPDYLVETVRTTLKAPPHSVSAEERQVLTQPASPLDCAYYKVKLLVDLCHWVNDFPEAERWVFVGHRDEVMRLPESKEAVLYYLQACNQTLQVYLESIPHILDNSDLSLEGVLKKAVVSKDVGKELRNFDCKGALLAVRKIDFHRFAECQVVVDKINDEELKQRYYELLAIMRLMRSWPEVTFVFANDFTDDDSDNDDNNGSDHFKSPKGCFLKCARNREEGARWAVEQYRKRNKGVVEEVTVEPQVEKEDLGADAAASADDAASVASASDSGMVVGSSAKMFAQDRSILGRVNNRCTRLLKSAGSSNPKKDLSDAERYCNWRSLRHRSPIVTIFPNLRAIILSEPRHTLSPELVLEFLSIFTERKPLWFRNASYLWQQGLKQVLQVFYDWVGWELERLATWSYMTTAAEQLDMTAEGIKQRQLLICREIQPYVEDVINGLTPRMRHLVGLANAWDTRMIRLPIVEGKSIGLELTLAHCGVIPPVGMADEDERMRTGIIGSAQLLNPKFIERWVQGIDEKYQIPKDTDTLFLPVVFQTLLSPLSVEWAVLSLEYKEGKILQENSQLLMDFSRQPIPVTLRDGRRINVQLRPLCVNASVNRWRKGAWHLVSATDVREQLQQSVKAILEVTRMSLGWFGHWLHNRNIVAMEVTNGFIANTKALSTSDLMGIIGEWLLKLNREYPGVSRSDLLPLYVILAILHKILELQLRVDRNELSDDVLRDSAPLYLVSLVLLASRMGDAVTMLSCMGGKDRTGMALLHLFTTFYVAIKPDGSVVIPELEATQGDEFIRLYITLYNSYHAQGMADRNAPGALALKSFESLPRAIFDQLCSMLSRKLVQTFPQIAGLNYFKSAAVPSVEKKELRQASAAFLESLDELEKQTKLEAVDLQRSELVKMQFKDFVIGSSVENEYSFFDAYAQALAAATPCKDMTMENIRDICMPRSSPSYEDYMSDVRSRLDAAVKRGKFDDIMEQEILKLVDGPHSWVRVCLTLLEDGGDGGIVLKRTVLHEYGAESNQILDGPCFDQRTVNIAYYHGRFAPVFPMLQPAVQLTTEVRSGGDTAAVTAAVSAPHKAAARELPFGGTMVGARADEFEESDMVRKVSGRRGGERKRSDYVALAILTMAPVAEESSTVMAIDEDMVTDLPTVTVLISLMSKRNVADVTTDLSRLLENSHSYGQAIRGLSLDSDEFLRDMLINPIKTLFDIDAVDCYGQDDFLKAKNVILKFIRRVIDAKFYEVDRRLQNSEEGMQSYLSQSDLSGFVTALKTVGITVENFIGTLCGRDHGFRLACEMVHNAKKESTDENVRTAKDLLLGFIQRVFPELDVSSVEAMDTNLPQDPELKSDSKRGKGFLSDFGPLGGHFHSAAGPSSSGGH